MVVTRYVNIKTLKQIICGIDDSLCCILIFSCNVRISPRINQCFGTHNKLSCIQITISYDNKLFMDNKRC